MPQKRTKSHASITFKLYRYIFIYRFYYIVKFIIFCKFNSKYNGKTCYFLLILFLFVIYDQLRQGCETFSIKIHEKDNKNNLY